MPKYQREVKISGKSSTELYQAVSNDIERFLSKVPLGNFQIDRVEAEKIVRVESKSFSAKLVCQDEKILLDVKLGLLVAPFRSKLDEGIDKWLSKTFS